jgi:predicted DNA-binding transcriptional regulator AlpA
MFNTADGIDAGTVFLREEELAKRWRVSPRTLQRKRQDRSGPPWLKLGGRIVYDMEDIQAWERRSRDGGAPQP